MAVPLTFDNSLGPRRHCRHAYPGIPIMDRTAYSELSLPDLRVLSALLRERSITRTAELMGTTQPAISKVLGRLRRQFSAPLFFPTRPAMQPTPSLPKACWLAGCPAERTFRGPAWEVGPPARGAGHRVLAAVVPPSTPLLQFPSSAAGPIAGAETAGVAPLPANLVNRLARPLG